MEYNNWQSNGSGSYSAQDGYVREGRRKEKKGISFMQLVASLLVVALLSSGLTAYFVKNQDNTLSPAQQSDGSMIVDESKTPGIGTKDADTQAGQDTPSSRLQLGSGTISGGGTSTEIIQRSMGHVVGIYISAATQTYMGDAREQDTGSGSGVLLTDDGYIVTNNHVIESGQSIRVYLQDGTEYAAELVGRDPYTDLAVIKIEAGGLPAATLGSSSSVVVGEPVYAIGNPLGVLTSSVSQGIISGLDRSITVQEYDMTLMQTDAAVNPGNSGGGLFNAAGELIGIVNAKSYGLDVEGIGFAIPMDAAKPIIMDLIDKGYVSGRPYIGISMQDVTLRYGSGGYDLFSFYRGNFATRVQVMAVQEGSAAEKAGILPNDIIIALNDTEISGSTQLSALLYAYKVGDMVTISVLRGNQQQDIAVTLDERKA